MKSFYWLAAVAVLVLAVVVAVLIALRPVEDTAAPQTGQSPTPAPTPELLSGPLPTAAPLSAAPANDPVTDGATAISEILGDESISHEQAARNLLTLLPRLSPEDQEEAAQHIANLSDEAVAAEWAQKLRKNQLPQPAAEVLFAALYNQPEDLFLPTAAAIADTKGHPFAQESIDTLEILVGPLPSNSTWSAHVTRELRTQQSQ
ncbi:MAG: hypothetical protein Fur0032_22980 [Terrimicrobiaceae bacterium]